jgi:hypothetical protein
MAVAPGDFSHFIYDNDVEGLRDFVAQGRDINAPATSNVYMRDMTLLSLSIFCQRFEIFMFLLQNGADPHLCVNGGEEAIVECMKIKNECSMKRFFGELLKSGIDINRILNSGETLLSKMIRSRKTTYALFLIECGADPLIKEDNSGMNAIELCETFRLHNLGEQIFASIGLDIKEPEQD